MVETGSTRRRQAGAPLEVVIVAIVCIEWVIPRVVAASNVSPLDFCLLSFSRRPAHQRRLLSTSSFPQEARQTLDVDVRLLTNRRHRRLFTVRQRPGPLSRRTKISTGLFLKGIWVWSMHSGGSGAVLCYSTWMAGSLAALLARLLRHLVAVDAVAAANSALS
jgi:hypothetical protein